MRISLQPDVSGHAPWISRSATSTAGGARRHPHWLALADSILAECTATASHRSGRWQRAADDPRIDAALLLAQLRGAAPAADPRSVATLRAVQRELADDFYLCRFRPEDRPHGDAESAFLMCGFLMALAVHQRGEHTEAVRWFERNRAACGPPGLFSEEYDVTQRQLRGNLPQAFVHAVMMEAALRPARADEPTTGSPAAD